MTARFWIDLAIVGLAVVGLWVAVDKTAAGIMRVWWWLRRDRVTPLLEDDDDDDDRCPTCGLQQVMPGDECMGCGTVRDLEELPPERSREELGFRGPPPESPEVRQWRRDEARRERMASAAELEHRAAYEALGFDYPSGLMARVRELTP